MTAGIGLLMWMVSASFVGAIEPIAPPASIVLPPGTPTAPPTAPHVTSPGMPFVAPSAETPTAARAKEVRELYIPFSELSALLERQPQRVMLSREEYTALLEKAAPSRRDPAPRSAAILAADYAVAVAAQSAEIRGVLTIEVLEEGLHAVPLEMNGVGLLTAKLDRRNAPIGSGENAVPRLFVEGVGRHELTFEAAVPLETDVAKQSLRFRLPRASTARMRLTAPGDVEIQSGAEVIRRTVDSQSGVTRFELLPRDGDIALNMSLNHRLRQESRAVSARSVLVDEVGEAYEKLRATISLSVPYRAIDHVRIAMPDGFEVLGVESPLLSRWEVRPEAKRSTLTVRFREPTSETTLIRLTAARASSRPAEWQFPRIEVLDAVSQASIVGLAVDSRWTTDVRTVAGLIPVDAAVLQRAARAADAATDNAAGLGAPAMYTAGVWYAPQSDYGVTANFRTTPVETAATMSVLLTVGDSGHKVQGAACLLSPVEKRFSFDLTVPRGWHVKEVASEERGPLKFERVAEPAKNAAEDRSERIRAAVPGGMPVDREFRVRFTAESVPVGWADAWQTKEIAFPVFRAAGASREEGVIAVQTDDDMTVRPGEVKGLTPLAAAELAKYGLGRIPAAAAYRMEDANYSATFDVRRTQPRLTARTFSFFRVDADGVDCRYELNYAIEEARAKQVALRLPKETPTFVSITGLDGLTVKEYAGRLEGEYRCWVVSPAEPRRGRIRLAVEFRQPMPGGDVRSMKLPIVAAEGTAYQSGMAVVEGCAGLDVRVETSARRADVGEAADAEYRPGRRLLGVYDFVGTTPEVNLQTSRHAEYPVYPVLIERCELDTNLSPDGIAQTRARYHLKTRAVNVRLELPPKAELWAAELNATALTPQRDEAGLRIALPAGTSSTAQVLQLTYALPIREIMLRGRVDVPTPRLRLLLDRDAAAVEIPPADLVWRLHLPEGYEAVRFGGTLTTDEIRRPPLAATAFLCGCWEWWRSFGVLSQEIGKTDSRRYANAKTAVPAPSSRPEMPDEKPQSSEASLESLARREDQNLVLRSGMPSAPQKPADGALMGKADDWKYDEKVKDAGAAGFSFAGRVGGKPPLLLGVRSLKVDVVQPSVVPTHTITFRSLGVEPSLSVTVLHNKRFAALRGAVLLSVGLVSLLLTRRRAKTKFLWCAIVLFASSLTPAFLEGVDGIRLCNGVFAMGAVAATYYAALGVLSWMFAKSRRCLTVVYKGSATKSPATVVLLFVVAAASGANAEPPLPSPETTPLPTVVRIADPPPLVYPADAVLVPYDPASPNGDREASRLLVPYNVYASLWNRAYPDRKIEIRPLPAAFALSGATYETRLADGEELRLRGRLGIDVFVDEPVFVPLPLSGAVLSQVTLDGKPARLGEAAKPSDPMHGKAAASLLQVVGKGRHDLEFEVCFRVTRRGGQRMIAGAIPAGPASLLTIAVPEARTELRVEQAGSRRVCETQTPGEVIRAALGPDGSVRLQWQPKAVEGQVDQSLTASSDAVFDVREDGLHLAWRLALDFRRGRRDRFRVVVPKTYFVEKVEGANVRGWEAKDSERGRVVEVTLLKTARDREALTLRLHCSGAFMRPGVAIPVETPCVEVVDAALHQGRVAIRRSPLLELRTLDLRGVVRADVPADSEMPSAEESPLGVRPFQAYRFSSTPFALRLDATPIAADATAEVRSVLRIGEYERTLESRVIYRTRQRPLHDFRMYLPDGFRLDYVSMPGEFHYAVTQQDKRSLLTVHSLAGCSGEASVTLRGRLPRGDSATESPLPRLEVLDVRPQVGVVAVQVDPAFEPTLVDPVHCSVDGWIGGYGWIKPEQHGLTRLIVRYGQGDYGGKIRLRAKTPDVVCDTITNVRVTNRAVEESILLNYAIRNAGIRRVSFLLPASMADARIQVPLLREKKLDRVERPGEPPRVRVSLELQDDVMNEFRVLVENDRVPTPGAQEAPIPEPEQGRVNRRYVTIERAGRDEVVTDDDALREVESLGRTRKEWAELTRILGHEVTMAYLTSPGAKQPRLTFRTRAGRTVQTVDARIGLAETTLVLDGNGAYRARQIFRVDNATEPFLEVRLPVGAELWTACVGGEPIKPVSVSGEDRRSVRIPLLKTAPGDLDYEVVLKYGGKTSELRAATPLEFPLIHCVNIRPEVSQVRLHLPEEYRWFDFGGTMRVVEDDAELQAGYLSYQNKLTQRIVQTLRDGDSFSRIRAAANLKVQNRLLDEDRSRLTPQSANSALQQELSANVGLMQQAMTEVDRLEKSEEKTVVRDNRYSLQQAFQSQSMGRAKNVLRGLGTNWSEEAAQQVAEASKQTAGERWLEQSGLAAKEDSEEGAVSKKSSKKKAAGLAGQLPATQQQQQPGGNRNAEWQPLTKSRSQPSMPDMVEMSVSPAFAPPAAANAQVRGDKPGEKRAADAETADRYRRQLEQQVEQQMALPRQGRPSQGGVNAVNNMPNADMGDKMPGRAPASRGVARSPVGQAADGVVSVDTASIPRDVDSSMRSAEGRFGARQSHAGGSPAGVAAEPQAPAAFVEGLAGVDFELPTRGSLYRFTTPRGEVRITARPVARTTVRRGSEAAGVALALVVVGFVVRGCRRRFGAGRTAAHSAIQG